jgi:hypothetical protein
MTWTFTLHGNKDTETQSSWETLPDKNSTSIWAIGPPPGHDTSAWLIGLHFANIDGHLILVEQRTFPNERGTPMLAEWTGDTDKIPDGGLGASVVKNLALLRMENQVRAAFADYTVETWGGGPYTAYPDGEPPEAFLNWSALTATVGIDTTDTTGHRTSGRKPLPDELLARVAYHYTEGLRNGRKVQLYVSGMVSTPDNPNPSSDQWIKKARERGFLTPAPKQGQAGGKMTDKAMDVLKQIGFLDNDGKRITQEKGDDE